MMGIKEAPSVMRAYLSFHNKIQADTLLDELSLSLDKNKPFVAGKIGGFELWAMRVAEFGYESEYVAAYDKLCNNAGFFSERNDIEADLKKYLGLMKKTLGDIDYLIRWQYQKEEYFIRRYCSKNLKDIDWLGVTYQNAPIGRILRGRKVLAITPFAEDVDKQYLRRNLIYKDEYLPEFELQTYKAVQTIAGNNDDRYKNWFQALNGMQQDINELDFEIALVGCGAYSLPLCSSIKKSGRSAIHMGGDLQLLFGIMGRRWENNDFIMSLKNDYWIYPNKQNLPKDYNLVEDGCYW